MSDTPRTDALIGSEALVWDLARQLERELAALRQPPADVAGLVEQLRLGSSISRSRNINLDYAKVADEAAAALTAQAADAHEHYQPQIDQGIAENNVLAARIAELEAQLASANSSRDGWCDENNRLKAQLAERKNTQGKRHGVLKGAKPTPSTSAESATPPISKRRLSK